MFCHNFCQSCLFFRANSNCEHMQLEENMGRDEQIISDLQVRLAIMECVCVCVCVCVYIRTCIYNTAHDSLLKTPQIPFIFLKSRPYNSRLTYLLPFPSRTSSNPAHHSFATSVWGLKLQVQVYEAFPNPAYDSLESFPNPAWLVLQWRERLESASFFFHMQHRLRAVA